MVHRLQGRLRDIQVGTLFLVLGDFIGLGHIAVQARSGVDASLGVVAHGDGARAHCGAHFLLALLAVVIAADAPAGRPGLALAFLALVRGEGHVLAAGGLGAIAAAPAKGAARIDVVAVLLVLAGDIAEAQGAGVQLEVAVVGGDQRAVELGVLLGADVHPVLAGDAGLLLDPVGLAGGLAHAQGTADAATAAQADAHGDTGIHFLAADLAGVRHRGHGQVTANPADDLTTAQGGAGDGGVLATAEAQLVAGYQIGVLLPLVVPVQLALAHVDAGVDRDEVLAAHGQAHFTTAAVAVGLAAGIVLRGADGQVVTGAQVDIAPGLDLGSDQGQVVARLKADITPGEEYRRGVGALVHLLAGHTVAAADTGTGATAAALAIDAALAAGGLALFGDRTAGHIHIDVTAHQGDVAPGVELTTANVDVISGNGADIPPGSQAGRAVAVHFLARAAGLAGRTEMGRGGRARGELVDRIHGAQHAGGLAGVVLTLAGALEGVHGVAVVVADVDRQAIAVTALAALLDRGFLAGVDADIAPGLQVDIAPGVHSRAFQGQVAPGLDGCILPGQQLAWRYRLLGIARLLLEAFAAQERGDAIAIALQGQPHMLLGFPVALVRTVAAGQHVDIAPRPHIQVALGRGRAADHVDVTRCLQGGVTPATDHAADTLGLNVFLAGFLRGGNRSETAGTGEPHLALVLVALAAGGVGRVHQVDVAVLVDQPGTHFSIALGFDGTGRKVDVRPGYHHRVIAGTQLAAHLGGAAGGAAVAALAQAEAAFLLLAVGAVLLLLGRDQADVPGSAHQQVVAGLELAADHGDVASAVEADTAVLVLADVDHQVVPGADLGGHVGGGGIGAAGGLALAPGTFLLLVEGRGLLVLGRSDDDVALGIEGQVVAGADLARYHRQVAPGIEFQVAAGGHAGAQGLHRVVGHQAATDRALGEGVVLHRQQVDVATGAELGIAGTGELAEVGQVATGAEVQLLARGDLAALVEDGAIARAVADGHCGAVVDDVALDRGDADLVAADFPGQGVAHAVLGHQADPLVGLDQAALVEAAASIHAQVVAGPQGTDVGQVAAGDQGHVAPLYQAATAQVAGFRLGQVEHRHQHFLTLHFAGFHPHDVMGQRGHLGRGQGHADAQVQLVLGSDGVVHQVAVLVVVAGQPGRQEALAGLGQHCVANQPGLVQAVAQAAPGLVGVVVEVAEHVVRAHEARQVGEGRIGLDQVAALGVLALDEQAVLALRHAEARQRGRVHGGERHAGEIHRDEADLGGAVGGDLLDALHILGHLVGRRGALGVDRDHLAADLGQVVL